MPLPKVLSHVVVPMLTAVIMCCAYLGGFHKPHPHGIEVAVVGTPAVAGPVAAGLQQRLGDEFTVTTVSTAEEARHRLQQLSLSGAYVPGAHPSLMTAPAASDPVNTLVTKVFTAVAAAQDKPLRLDEVVPLEPSDPIGQNGFFFMVALSVGAYSTGLSIGAAAASRKMTHRLLIGLGATVVITTVMTAIASIAFGMFPGDRLAVWGTSMLYVSAIMAIAIGLHPLLGRFSGMVFSAMFVAFNFTSSGGVLPPSLQGGLFDWLNQFWIGSGFISAVQRIVYFPDAPLHEPFEKLMLWLLGGAICVAISSVMERRIYTQWLSRNQAKVSADANAAAGVVAAPTGAAVATTAGAGHGLDFFRPDMRHALLITPADPAGYATQAAGAPAAGQPSGAHLPEADELDRLDDEAIDEETELELEENLGRS